MFHVAFEFENDPGYTRYMELNSWDEVQEFLCSNNWSEVWANGNLFVSKSEL